MAPFAASLDDPALFVERAYIDGAWTHSKSGETFTIRNPATDELLGSCPECNVDDLEAAVRAAATAFNTWRAESGRARARILKKWFDLITQHRVDIGRIITAENGKARPDAEGEALFSASFFECNPSARAQVLRQPVGVCGLITPWNFPMAMAARKVAAALAAGCTVVLKSDGLTPFAANALAVLGERAGLPGAGSLKKLSLELGGNAPFIVFDDADVEVAVQSAIASKFKVTGQTCVCANRIFVQEGIYERFAERLVAEVAKFRVGNGADEGVTHGPLTTSVAKVEEHVQDALTVLGDVDDSMKVMSEETFGPLAALTKFTTEDEVVARANSVDVGLAAYLVTSDLGRYYRVTERLDYGMVAVNTGVISDSAAPFGGIKQSGFGREGSKYGCDDYMVYKTVITGGINTVYKSGP
ncbi:unnamed protein product [Parascedosporium putredinis]|uniref:Aldehyde dehydrogenase domain-containing protein n=1 Tax=Parascedosporium putredinis TaxID=1442378 RepID=A0A9P1M8N5_9PEZI|nr:unnamed protein product [Parascedosporium putredinis]CAI7990266.1 unnamed protein product [Parascedosporium putredinis]